VEYWSTFANFFKLVKEHDLKKINEIAHFNTYCD